MITFLSTDRADEIEREIMRREVEGLDWLSRRLARMRAEEQSTRDRDTAEAKPRAPRKAA